LILINRLYRERLLFLGQDIDSEISNQLIGLMVYLSTESEIKDFYLFIMIKKKDKDQKRGRSTLSSKRKEPRGARKESTTWLCLWDDLLFGPSRTRKTKIGKH
jgi:hypothetical protein